jgi:hypothetical protein
MRRGDELFIWGEGAIEACRDQMTEVLASAFGLTSVYHIAPLACAVQCVLDVLIDVDEAKFTNYLASKL